MKLNKNIIATLLGASILLQFIIITYNHLTGYIHVTGAANFAWRLIFGAVFSFLTALVLSVIDIRIINFLNLRLPWNSKSPLRILIEILLAGMTGIVLGIAVTLIVNLVSPYSEDLREVSVSNALITAVVNLIIMISLEAYNFFRQERIWLEKARYLEQENNSIRYEVLKNQLNPHFLFNSLNVLSSLVHQDNRAAQDFIDEFALIYRYILDSIDKKVVTVEEEMEFSRSFLYLQKVRFEGGFEVHTNIDAPRLKLLLPPLSVQLLIENIFKHNIISLEDPLIIHIFTEGNTLVVKNLLRLKNNRDQKSGIGLNNLVRRYKMLTTEKPEFAVIDDSYIARIPIIETL